VDTETSSAAALMRAASPSANSPMSLAGAGAQWRGLGSVTVVGEGERAGAGVTAIKLLDGRQAAVKAMPLDAGMLAICRERQGASALG